ncbi:MAG: ribosome-associated translation inhibitor RaiA [Alphaproteobacteria bacterium]|nr:MAG: ribosome-associated translation inhibitor RaiA [Alphaproteobacteria bacterium]
MQITVTGKNIDVGDALRTHIENRLGQGLVKFFNDTHEATVTLTKERYLFRADCTVHAGHDLYLQSHGEADDIYAAFDAAADKLEKRLRRYKRRLTDHHKKRVERAEEEWRVAAYVIAGDAQEDDDLEAHGEGGDEPIIIAETTTAIPEMTVGEAVMRMDLAEQPAFMFRNSAHGGVNVVYRRPDGNIGWVDPENVKTKTV